MAKREQILRYMLIIRLLRQNKKATFNEIEDFLQFESEIQGYNMNISKRTFQRDVRDIDSLFQIEISYDFSEGCYYIAYDEKDDANTRMLEAFDLFNTLNLSFSMSHLIYFDKQHPQGVNHIMGVLYAIRNLKTLRFNYKKFNDNHITQREVAPFAIKEYKRKWYLYAKDYKDNIEKTFGLDRIKDLEFTNNIFTYPDNLNLQRIFKHTYGIYQPGESQKPQTIILDFDPRKGEEIIAHPLHATQHHQVLQDGTIRITLHVYETYDLVADILQCGDLVKVSQPDSLKKKLINIYHNAIKLYK